MVSVRKDRQIKTGSPVNEYDDLGGRDIEELIHIGATHTQIVGMN